MKYLLLLLFLAGCTESCKQFAYPKVQEIISCRIGGDSANCVFKDENGYVYRKYYGDLSVGDSVAQCVKN
jgi:hypothetical protein